MSSSVGIDLTSIEDVRDAIRAFGDRYLERVYTLAERSECGVEPARLAARFAAKEAVIKALASEGQLPWTSIGVRHTTSGQPCLELRGAAARLASDRGFNRLSVSLTHEGPFAAAVVIAESG